MIDLNRKQLLAVFESALIGLCAFGASAGAQNERQEGKRDLNVFGMPPMQNVCHAGLSYWQYPLIDNIYSDWAPTQKPVPGVTKILASVDDDGRLYDVKITGGSGDAQADLEALESVLGASPFHGELPNKESRSIVQLTFNDDNAKRAFSSLALNQDRAAESSRQSNSVCFHKIPLSVLRRYPGQITRDELASDGNLIRVDNGDSGKESHSIAITRLTKTYERWAKFFLKHTQATKEEILDYAKSL